MAPRSRLTPLLAVAGLGGVGLLLWAASRPPEPAAAPPPLPDPQGPPEPAPAEKTPASPAEPPPRANTYQPPPFQSGTVAEGVIVDDFGGGSRTENLPPVWPPGDPEPSADAPPPEDALQAYRLGWWNADAAARGVASFVEGVYGRPPASPLLTPWYALGTADRQASRPPRYGAAQSPPISVDTALGQPPGSPSADPDIARMQRENYVLGYLHRDAQDPQRRYYFTVSTGRPTSLAEWQRWWDLGYQQRAEGRAPLFPIEIIDSGGRPVPQVDSRKGGL